MIADPTDVTSVKLVDFGLSIKIDKVDILGFPDLRCGTKLYMAPEVHRQEQYNRSVDMWSLGITIYKLISGEHPLFHQKSISIFEAHLQNRTEISYTDEFSDLAKDFISHLL